MLTRGQYFDAKRSVEGPHDVKILIDDCLYLYLLRSLKIA